MIFAERCWYLKAPNQTHTPTGPRPYFNISTHTYTHNPIYSGNKWRWHTSIFTQQPTHVSCVKQCEINVTHLSRRNNTTSVSDSSRSRSLSSLHRWRAAPIFTRDYLPIGTLLLIFYFSNIFLFVYLPSPSIYSRSANVCLWTQIERFFALSSQDTPPHCWLATSVFWDSVRCCGQKHFSKITKCTLILTDTTFDLKYVETEINRCVRSIFNC